MGADINWNNANWVNLQCAVMYILFIDSPCMQKVACIIFSYNLIMVKEFLNEITWTAETVVCAQNIELYFYFLKFCCIAFSFFRLDVLL